MSARAAALSALVSDLRAWTGDPAAVRPFVCEGSPLDCAAFVVGSTPATGMAEAFWTFWDAEDGFRKTAWLEAYARAKGRGGRGMSSTRRLLERVAHAAAPVRVLEANVHGPPGARDAEILERLLAAACPRAVLAHGREAAAYLTARLGTPLPADRFAEVAAPWGALRVRAVRHLSRGWSDAAADALGAELRAAAGSAAPGPAGHGSG